MSGSSPPPDNSMQVEMMREKAAAEERQRVEAKELAHKGELAGLRTQARAGAGTTVGNYFSSRGIDPTRYSGSIESQLNNILSGISPMDENPGSAFTGAGESIYDMLQTGERSKYGGQLNKIFSPNFETTRVPFTLDDPYLSGIEAEQFSDADSIIKNMLDRGVLTASGATSAREDLESQRAGVRSRLNEVGTGLLSGEQEALRGIANEARQTAGGLELGSDFDPYSYQGRADESFNSFLSTLGDQIRAGLPGKLFNTAGLAAIGGAGQGAGNTAFNPAAAAGVNEEDTTGQSDNTRNPNSIF